MLRYYATGYQSPMGRGFRASSGDCGEFGTYLTGHLVLSRKVEADIFFEDRSGHILGDDLLSRLISMPNVIVTSHQAFLTEEALNNIAHTTVDNIISCFENDGVCDNELCYRCGHIDQCRKERKERCF